MTRLTLEDAVEWLRNQPESEKTVRDCYFDADVVHAAQRFWKSDEFRAVLVMLRNQKPFSRVLDLGAGRGIASFAFEREGFDVIALEPDASSAGANAISEIIRTANVHVRIAGGYGEKLPFRSESFEVIYIRQVLHHAQDLKLLCGELHRVLKRGGLFLATREHVLSKKEDLPIFRENHPLDHLTGGENAFLLFEYLDAIVEAGFDLKSVLGPYDTVINYFPYTSAQVKAMAAAILKPYVPARVLRPFMEIPIIFRLCSRHLSSKDETPGRLYSFLAIKS